MIIDLEDPIFSYDRFIISAKRLSQEYKAILKCVTIGKSHDNRDILLLKLGMGKNYMVCCSGVHARETINPIVLMRIAEFYADLYINYKVERQDLKNQLLNSKKYLENEYQQMLYQYCTYELLQTFTILFIPLLNPDGYMISLEGFDSVRNEQLKNRCLQYKISAEQWKFNARGVDINRNFPSKLWQKKSKNDRPASENETRALMGVFEKYHPLGFLDFHSRGESIYYYRNTMSDLYNEKQYKIASRLKKLTNYDLMPPEEEIDLGDSGGNTVHYFSEQFHKPALTIETVDENADFPLNPKYRGSVFDDLKLVILEFGSIII
ncbi:MAG: hypothetical protein E7255_05295 [Lachnospiraceae bacterium]|jgi:g-D-glutamyl-meso-diaminopimelate peptidase|nr:hypothetical protein [Lachnospiraceae bacterium]